jgi:hypothetical protein
MYDKIKAQPVFPLSGVAFAMGGIGAVVGAASAAAKNISMIKKNEIDGVEAVKTVLKESAGVGLAAAAATAVTVAVAPRSGFFSILGFALVATGTKMLWDKAAYPEKKALAMMEPELQSETDLEKKEEKK